MNYKQKKILKLMTENTGTHFLDSGGTDGRMWQRNKKRKISFDEDIHIEDGYATIPIQVYMDTMFETNEMTARMNKVLSKEYYWVDEAVEVLEGAFLYDELVMDTDNTYNHDNDLSQDFQYHLFKGWDGDTYCVFQLHNGADIRGGYTSAQVFKVNDFDYFFIGWSVDFYDNSTNQQFDSIYHIPEDEYEFDEKEGGYRNKETNEVMYPYSSAMGF